MKSSEIRKVFLEFFKIKNHKILPSDSLIPSSDPTLLFTSAGMTQFKNYFTGVQKGLTRAATSQKCFRTTDIEKIGDTPRHLSFFEMLGNFSFGDYFKEDAIKWAWEFLTEAVKLDKSKLYITIYKDDNEALGIWKRIISEDRIYKLGAETNFWNMGTTGPCGPCSEIIYDLGKDLSCSKKNCDPGCDCARWLEVWNLVFTQFDRKEDGPLSELPQKNIDTGMGLERLAMVVNSKRDVFETDLFQPIISYLTDTICSNSECSPPFSPKGGPARRSGGSAAQTRSHGIPSTFTECAKRILRNEGFSAYASSEGQRGVSPAQVRCEAYGSANKNTTSFKLIADHTRAILFLMSDGIIASNEGRGYVLRRIIRRAQRAAKLLGYEKPFLYKTITKVVDIMSDVYPDILTQADNIAVLLKNEEEKFLETLGGGLKILDGFLDASLKNSKNKILSGKDAFYLYETYGFPFDLTKEICAEKGFSVDEESFIIAQNNAKAISRASWIGAESKEIAIYEEIKKRFGPTDFVGYENVSVESEVIAIIKDKKVSQNIIENEEGEIVLRQTHFYAESGGQVGDTGKMLKTEDTGLKTEAEVIDTLKPIDGIITHKVKVKKGALKTRDLILATVDVDRRRDIARHHTATHLLHKALRELLGKSVVQAGSLVAPDYLRFDFTYPTALQGDEIVAVEKSVNDAVMDNMKVCIKNEALSEAKKKGAMALFGEKYGEVVRMVAVEDKQSPFSLELCGGIHVQSTGEIGMFKIISESSIGRGIRRITAVCGRYAQEYVYGLQAICEESSSALGVAVKEVPLAIKKITAHQKNLEKEIEKLKTRAINESVSDIAKTQKILGNIKFISAVISDYEEKSLMSFAEGLLSKITSGIVVVVNKKGLSSTKSRPGLEGQLFSYVVMISKDIAVRLPPSLTANNIAKIFAQAASSSGGGKETMARGGGKDVSKISDGIKAVEEFIENLRFKNKI